MVRFRVVDLVEIHAKHDVGVDGLGPLARRGDDHLPPPRLKVLRRVRAGTETPGRLDHDVDAELRPRERCRLALGERADLLIIDPDHAVGVRHVRGEAPEHRVEPEQMCQRRRVGDVVDGDDLDVGAMLVGGADDASADAAEAIDGDTSRHVQSPDG